MKVRTRVAPSPTGDPHVGTAYMALFSLCFARRFGGQFVLRIEDTDAVRSSRQSERKILESLRWLGLDWDEGPDKPGPYGPYRQSERLDTYKQHIDFLLSRGHAFRCFCTPERLESMRAEQIKNNETTRYDGCCLSLSEDQVQKKLASGKEHVVRTKVPEDGTCIIKDRLRGDVPIEYSQIDMQVLQKSDGNPTYHLAVVVDDHLMEITHIIRGEEWISSAPKHKLLYEYFGWDMPELIHMPLLRNPDKSKLSKRKNPTSIGFYERMGFLPEAVINYLGMLGWSMPSGEEKFSLGEMINHFDLERISLGAPIFDTDKLRWLNGRWLREELDNDAFANRISEWAYNRENLKRIIPLVKERVDVFSEITDMIAFFVSGLPTLSEDDLVIKNLSKEQIKKILQFALWDIDVLASWDRDSLNNLFKELGEDLGLKVRDILAPIFIAISGKPVAPPLFDSMEIIGPDLTRARLKNALDTLGGVSKKLTKKLEKEYQARGGSGG